MSRVDEKQGCDNKNGDTNVKVHMDKETKDFQAELMRHLPTVFGGQSTSFMGILSRSQNCDPAFLVDTLNEMEERRLLRACGEGSAREYVLTTCSGGQTSVPHKSCGPVQSRCWGDPRHSILDSGHFRDITRAIHDALPVPGLVYSQWWFSEPAYPRLIDLLFHLAKKDARVAFAGASTLGAAFSHCTSIPPAIIDVDEVLLKRLTSCVDKRAQFISRDILNPLDASLQSKFDIVFADPPWSSSTLKAFLVRGSEMLAAEGSLVISFPPTFTRPSVRSERRSLLRLADLLGLSFRMEMPGFTEYDVPLFEHRAYKEHGIELCRAWRKGDVLIFTKRSEVTDRTDAPIEASSAWDQYDYGATRLFLKKNGSDREGPARIAPISGKNDFMYDSTSSRPQLWKHARMVSTQNHIADVSGTLHLASILQDLLGGTTDLNNRIRYLNSAWPEVAAALSILFDNSNGRNGSKGESKWHLPMERTSHGG